MFPRDHLSKAGILCKSFVKCNITIGQLLEKVKKVIQYTRSGHRISHIYKSYYKGRSYSRSYTGIIGSPQSQTVTHLYKEPTDRKVSSKSDLHTVAVVSLLLAVQHL